MDDDLIARLRAYRPTNEWGDGVHHVICDEAADRINTLTAELAKALRERTEARAEAANLRADVRDLADGQSGSGHGKEGV